MNLNKDSIKASVKRALLLRNLVLFNLKIYSGLRLRMLLKKWCLAWFLHKVDKECLHKLKNIVKLIILRQLEATQFNQTMEEVKITMLDNHHLISLLELVDKWWPATTILEAMASPWTQVKAAIILVQNKDWRAPQWTKEYKEV